MYNVSDNSRTRAKERLENARRELELPSATRTARRQELLKKLQALSTYCSQVGDVQANPRPLSYCEFSPDSSMLATASWSGLCNLWSVPDCKVVRTLDGHTNKVECVTWHPKATIATDVLAEGSEKTCVMATCSFEGILCFIFLGKCLNEFWNLNEFSNLD